MVIKYFLVYCGISLTCAILLVSFVKNFAPGFSINSKKPILQGILLSILFGAVAWACTLFSNYLFWVYWAFAGIFLLFGILLRQLFHKTYFFFDKDNRYKVLFGENLFSLAIVLFTVIVFSCLTYFFTSRNFLFFPMLMSGLAFFLPSLIVKSFEAAFSIPPPVYNHWIYPVEVIPYPFDNRDPVIMIAFDVAIKASDKKKDELDAKGPESMTLGDLFYHFIGDYYKARADVPIELENEDGVYEWWFRKKPKWYEGQKILDPELSLSRNGVRENAVIICERILTK